MGVPDFVRRGSIPFTLGRPHGAKAQLHGAGRYQWRLGGSIFANRKLHISARVPFSVYPKDINMNAEIPCLRNQAPGVSLPCKQRMECSAVFHIFAFRGILELGPGVPLQLSLEAGSSLRAVRRGNLLRLHLWPLLGHLARETNCESKHVRFFDSRILYFSGWELDAGPCQAMCSMQGGCGFVDCETFAIEHGANRSNAATWIELDALWCCSQCTDFPAGLCLLR